LNLEPTEGLGVVVPHRAQRAAIAEQIADVVVRDAITNEVVLSAVDTVERYQGDERLVMVYSATESDRDYCCVPASS
jgi:superfamily I DNA and/or RNA helicase